MEPLNQLYKMQKYNLLKFWCRNKQYCPFAISAPFSTQKTTNPISQKILSLEEFIESRNRNSPKDLFERNDDSLFSYGQNPRRLRNELYVYFKYTFWQQNKFGEQRLLDFVEQMEKEETQIKLQLTEEPNNQSLINKYQLIRAYYRQLSITLLPITITERKFSQKYIQILINYLEQTKELTPYQMHFIFDNFDRLLFPQISGKQFLNQKDDGWLIAYAFDKFVAKISLLYNTLSSKQKSLIIMISKTLRSNQPRLLQFVKNELQQQKKQISMQHFLSGLNYLAMNNCFPYQFFYKNKQNLMTIIQSAQSLSEKKVQTSLYMLEIFSRVRLIYCEKIINRLLICIEQNLQASDIRQLIKIFFYYSRLKSSIKYNFVAKIVERIYLFMDMLDEKGYSLIIKAISNLNYQDLKLVQILKDYNYELFLTNLKYGCQNLGEFYKKMIEEVQTNFKNDELRSYPLQDQIITRKTQGIQQNKQDNNTPNEKTEQVDPLIIKRQI